jgi:hypothetical protein
MVPVRDARLGTVPRGHPIKAFGEIKQCSSRAREIGLSRKGSQADRASLLLASVLSLRQAASPQRPKAERVRMRIRRIAISAAFAAGLAELRARQSQSPSQLGRGPQIRPGLFFCSPLRVAGTR